MTQKQNPISASRLSSLATRHRSPQFGRRSRSYRDQPSEPAPGGDPDPSGPATRFGPPDFIGTSHRSFASGRRSRFHRDRFPNPLAPKRLRILGGRNWMLFLSRLFSTPCTSPLRPSPLFSIPCATNRGEGVATLPQTGRIPDTLDRENSRPSMPISNPFELELRCVGTEMQSQDYEELVPRSCSMIPRTCAARDSEDWLPMPAVEIGACRIRSTVDGRTFHECIGSAP